MSFPNYKNSQVSKTVLVFDVFDPIHMYNEACIKIMCPSIIDQLCHHL